MDDGGLDDAVESVISLPFTEADDLHVTILEELSDTRSRVGLSDLGGLLGVEPDYGLVLFLCLAAFRLHSHIHPPHTSSFQRLIHIVPLNLSSCAIPYVMIHVHPPSSIPPLYCPVALIRH